MGRIIKFIVTFEKVSKVCVARVTVTAMLTPSASWYSLKSFCFEVVNVTLSVLFIYLFI